MATATAKPATGKLGIMVVGLGAVSTTFMTGVLMTRKGLGKPVGSMTQYDKIRVGRGENKKYLKYNEIVSMPSLNDIVFTAWDVYPANAYESALNAHVLKEKDIEPVKDELIAIKPMKAAFDHNYAKRLDGDNVKQCKDRWDMVEQLREDIRNFKKESGVERVVVLWAASTEIYVAPDMKYHGTVAALEAAMKANDVEHVAPSMCYAYAALMEDCPFVMGAPNTTVDIPAMWELAEAKKLPIAGKDFKTGQTLVKSGFAPIIGTRMLGLNGWFSTATVSCSTNLLTSAPRKCRSSLLSNLSSWVKNNQTSTATTTTRCVSTTTHHATTTRKVGTTSTSLVGWAIQCRLRSISSAATLSSQHLSASTSACSSTSHTVLAAGALNAS